MNESRHMHHCAMSYCMNESCYIPQWVMSYILISHLTYINALCHVYSWVISRTSMRHVIYVDESSLFVKQDLIVRSLWNSAPSVQFIELCMQTHWIMHVDQCVMLYIGMSHVTYIHESCHILNASSCIYKFVMSCIRMSHVTYINASCHIYEWALSHTPISMHESRHVHQRDMSCI